MARNAPWDRRRPRADLPVSGPPFHLRRRSRPRRARRPARSRRRLRGAEPAEGEEARPPEGSHADEPFLRELNAHPEFLRAGGQAAGGRRGQHEPARLLDEQGRDADRHRGNAERHAAGPPGRAPRRVRGRVPAVAEGRLQRDQRRRRPARASDPGAARRAVHAARVRPGRGADVVAICGDVLHSRVARSNVLHAAGARRARAPGRAADADAGRRRALGRRGVPRHDAAASPASTW